MNADQKTPAETPAPNSSDAQSSSSASNRWSLLWWVPVLGATAVMGYLAYAVLLPSTSEPGSNLYTSSMGYPSKQRQAGEPIEVEVVQLSEESFTDYVAAAGETVALVDVDIRTQLTGVVKKVFVEEGQTVSQGDPLLELDPAPWQDVLKQKTAELEISQLNTGYYPDYHASEQEELEATVTKCQKHLAIAKSRLARYQSLQEDLAASAEEISLIEEVVATRSWELATAQQQLAQHLLDAKKELDQSRQNIALNESLVSQAQRDLESTRLFAPCDGLVARVSVQPGELVLQEEEVAVRLANQTVFQAFIDQTRVDAVQPGDPATVRLVAQPGVLIEGTVIRVNPSVDTNGRVVERGRVDTRFTYSAWVRLDNVNLPPGLQGHVEFRKDIKRQVIPESAVIHLSGGYWKCR